MDEIEKALGEYGRAWVLLERWPDRESCDEEVDRARLACLAAITSALAKARAEALEEARSTVVGMPLFSPRERSIRTDCAEAIRSLSSLPASPSPPEARCGGCGGSGLAQCDHARCKCKTDCGECSGTGKARV